MCSRRSVTVLLVGVLVQFVGCDGSGGPGSQDAKLDEAISVLKSMTFTEVGEITERGFQDDWKKLNLAFNEVKSTGPKVDKVREIIAIWKKVEDDYDSLEYVTDFGPKLELLGSITENQVKAKKATDSAGF